LKQLQNAWLTFFPAANKVYRNTKTYRGSCSRLMRMVEKNLLALHNHAESKPGIRTSLSLSCARTERTAKQDPDTPVHTGVLLHCYRSIFFPSCSDFASPDHGRARDTMSNGSDYTQLSKDGAIHIPARLWQNICTHL